MSTPVVPVMPIHHFHSILFLEHRPPTCVFLFHHKNSLSFFLLIVCHTIRVRRPVEDGQVLWVTRRVILICKFCRIYK
jgi:hypothetical protein